MAEDEGGPAMAEDEGGPAMAENGNEPAMTEDGNEPAMAEDGNEPVMTEDGDKPAMAEDGDKPAMAENEGGRQDGGKSATATLYLDHFGLRELPFGITPDTDFAYALRAHQEAFNTLMLALESGEGFIKITGEVGAGKTLLCRRLLKTLGGEWVSAYLPNPGFDADTLLRALAEELSIGEPARFDQYHLLREINRALLELAHAGKRVVALIDEAQAMPVETLEALRLLSNLETEKQKLLQIVLFGQPELDEKLNRPEIRQLRQRIVFHYRLSGLDEDEVANYVAYRLRVAGHLGEELFTPAALRVLYRASGGAPRLINVLAHKSLMAVYGEGRQKVEARHARLARRDTEGARQTGWLGWP